MELSVQMDKTPVVSADRYRRMAATETDHRVRATLLHLAGDWDIQMNRARRASTNSQADVVTPRLNTFHYNQRTCPPCSATGPSVLSRTQFKIILHQAFPLPSDGSFSQLLTALNG